MRYVTLIATFLLFGSASSSGQYDWPDGSLWTFTDYGMTVVVNVNGVLALDSDTIVGGQLAQQFVGTGLGADVSTGAPVDIHFEYYTYSAGGVIFSWYQSQWDTLYWFDAEPGDHWYVLGFDGSTTAGSCPPENTRYLVSSTDEVMINGVQLKRVNVQIGMDQPPWVIPQEHNFIERLVLPIYDPWTSLCDVVCGAFIYPTYYDPELGDINLLGLTTGAAEQPTIEGPRSWLQEDHFVVQWPATPSHPVLLELIDMRGSRVLSMRSMAQHELLPVSGLAPGAYLFKSTSKDGQWVSHLAKP